MSKNQAILQVTSPLFYEARKGAKIFYILGTNHSAPLKVLPKACRNFIKGTVHLIHEADENITSYTYESLIEQGYVAPDLAEQDWSEQLSEERQQKILDCFENIKEMYPEGFNPKCLKLWVIQNLVSASSQNSGMDISIFNDHIDKYHLEIQVSVIASAAKQSRNYPENTGLLCRYAPRNDRSETPKFKVEQVYTKPGILT